MRDKYYAFAFDITFDGCAKERNRKLEYSLIKSALTWSTDVTPLIALFKSFNFDLVPLKDAIQTTMSRVSVKVSAKRTVFHLKPATQMQKTSSIYPKCRYSRASSYHEQETTFPNSRFLERSFVSP